MNYYDPSMNKMVDEIMNETYRIMYETYMKGYTSGYIDGINHVRWVTFLIMFFMFFLYFWLKYRPVYKIGKKLLSKEEENVR